MFGCSISEKRDRLSCLLEEHPAFKEILEHYSNDSLKLKAACFLLKNLQYHKGYSEKEIEPLLKLYQIFGENDILYTDARDSIFKMYGNRLYLQPEKEIPDTQIDPQYLINNIDWAFKVWKEQPWGKNVSFEVFCEYILPYRIADEPLMEWREKIYERFNPLLDSIRALPQATNPIFVAEALKDSIAKIGFSFSSSLGIGPHIGPHVVEWNSGNCREATDRMIYIFRALGIPCGCDYMPLRGDNNVSHFWNFTIDSNGESYYIYEGTKMLPVRQFWGIKSKVYRQTFSLNEELYNEIGDERDSIFPKFSEPHYIDVTKLYGGKAVRDLKMPVDKISRLPQNGIIYLCGAAWRDWKPLCWTRVEGDYIRFEDVEGGVVMILAIYEHEKLKTVSDPFLFDNTTGGIHFFTPSKINEDVKVLNKYHQFLEDFPKRMVGGVFEASNNSNFIPVDTLFQITDMPLRLNNTIFLNQEKKYRYVRYFGPEKGFCNVAKISFYKEATDSITLKGKIIGTSNVEHGYMTHDYTNVFDDNHLTSFDYHLPYGGWAGMDLGHPVNIKKIIYTPRNRDNYIKRGNTYELYYYANSKWISSGRQIANSDSLMFSVPKGALLYLHNYSGGKDERIFEYTDGKQLYW